MPRPPVLTDVHDLPDDLDWLTAVDETITARSPQQPGPCPSPTAQQARPWPDRPQAESHDELLTELVHSAETARPWQKNELNDKHITPTRPPDVTRPPVLAGAREPLDDLDWLTAVDATITARSPQQPGPCPSPTAQQARPWPDRPLRNPRRVAHRARAPGRSPTTPDLNNKISSARGTRRPPSTWPPCTRANHRRMFH